MDSLGLDDPKVKQVVAALKSAGFQRDGGSPLTPPDISGGPTDIERLGKTHTLRRVGQTTLNSLVGGEAFDSFERRFKLLPFMGYISSDEFDPNTIKQPAVSKDWRQWDAAAWYCSLHFFGCKWGIYICLPSVYKMAFDILSFHDDNLAREIVEELKEPDKWREKFGMSREERINTRRESQKLYEEKGIGKEWLEKPEHKDAFEDCLWTALLLLYLHEMFHHLVEAVSTRMEFSVEKPLYRDYSDCVYKPLKGTSDLLEEALANAYSQRMISRILLFPPNRRKTENIDVRGLCLKYLEARFSTDPPGYDRAGEYISDDGFERGLGLLIRQIKESKKDPIHSSFGTDILAGAMKPLVHDDDFQVFTVAPKPEQQIMEK